MGTKRAMGESKRNERNNGMKEKWEDQKERKKQWG